MKKITRRKLFKIIGSLFSFTTFGIWISGTQRTLSMSRKDKKIISSTIASGLSFVDDLIVYRFEEDIKIFSSSCTHLGCKINHVSENELICPCHGSRFSTDGMVLNGPAQKSLRKLKHEIDLSSGDIIVYV